MRSVSTKLIFAFVLGVLAAAAGAALLWHFAEIPADRLHAQLLEQPEFLADHPDVLSAAQVILQNRRLAAESVQRAALMSGKWKSLLHPAFSPTLGAADAPMTLVEFTDYTCEPCRLSAPAVRDTLKANGDLRIAILLMPTGGALSEYAARVALAAYRQDPSKFPALHEQLISHEGPLTQESILAAAGSLRYDVEQISREASNSEVRRYFGEVRNFAEEMNVYAVPAFVLRGQLILGRVKSKQLSEMVETGRVPNSNTHTDRA